MRKPAFLRSSAAFLGVEELAGRYFAALVVEVSFVSSEFSFVLVLLLSFCLKLPLRNELGTVRITGFVADLAARVTFDECSTL